MKKFFITLVALSLQMIAFDAWAHPGCGNTVKAVHEACEHAVSKGATATSCYRSLGDQARIKAYYDSLGRYGQAGRVSRHTQGLACDFNMGFGENLKSLKRLNAAGHVGNHYSTDGH